jgi:hypothetical protein
MRKSHYYLVSRMNAPRFQGIYHMLLAKAPRNEKQGVHLFILEPKYVTLTWKLCRADGLCLEIQNNRARVRHFNRDYAMFDLRLFPRCNVV